MVKGLRIIMAKNFSTHPIKLPWRYSSRNNPISHQNGHDAPFWWKAKRPGASLNCGPQTRHQYVHVRHGNVSFCGEGKDSSHFPNWHVDSRYPRQTLSLFTVSHLWDVVLSPNTRCSVSSSSSGTMKLSQKANLFTLSFS